MQALDLAIRNFAVAEHLLHLQQLFEGAGIYEPGTQYAMALWTEMAVPEGTAVHHIRNAHLILGIHGSVTVPTCLTATQGLDILLRQAVVVSCSALESFLWDVLRENALTVIRARGRKADDSLKNITLTLDDYLSLDEYPDPNERLRQIILRRFERGALYDLEKIDEIMGILNVRDFWKEVSDQTGFEPKEIRSQLGDLINRRNQIAHRADRPEEGTPLEECDALGLRPITHAWTSTRITTAKAFVQSAAAAAAKALTQLELIIAQKEEQKIARETLARPAPMPAGSGAVGKASGSVSPSAPDGPQVKPTPGADASQPDTTR
jgi:hypothetical protein